MESAARNGPRGDREGAKRGTSGGVEPQTVSIGQTPVYAVDFTRKPGGRRSRLHQILESARLSQSVANPVGGGFWR